MRTRSVSTTFLLGALAMLPASSCNPASTARIDQPIPVYLGPSGPRVTRVDKVDLLLVVDNSPSMADKQRELSRRLPLLVKQLTNPDPTTTGRPKHPPIADLHVAVVSSSLGSFGTSVCDPKSKGAHMDDRGHALPRDGETATAGYYVTADDAKTTATDVCPKSIDASSLRWINVGSKDPTAPHVGVPGGTELQVASSCVIETVGEDGCGYEQPWEAMYRFLVDPTPYDQAKVQCTFGATSDDCTTGGKPNLFELVGVDDDLLKERKAFLRSDSFLAVVIISDENDASLKPAQLDWIPFAYGAGKMLRGFASCANVPDDVEPETTAEYNDLHAKYGCKSCFEDVSDPSCTLPWAKDPLNADVDARNLRAFEMTRRFGYNFLWSRRRYVDAFKSSVVPGLDASGARVGLPNPVFAGGFRSPDLIGVTAIVGVPPQLVDDASGAAKTMTEADWEKILSPDLTKRDPHMIESIAPRTKYGVAPFAGDRAVDPVHGGDRDIPGGDDLQYACIGKRDVDTATEECAGDAAKSSPLCAPDGRQSYFKAYPGLRHLRIVHDLGASGVAQSICSESYATAMKSVVDQVEKALDSGCFKSVLNADSTGRVDCQRFTVFPGPTIDGATRCEDVGGYCTLGAAPCRVGTPEWPVLSPEDAAAAYEVSVPVPTAGGPTRENVQAYASSGNVYAKGSDGVAHLVCEIRQLVGPDVPLVTSAGCLRDPAFDLPRGEGGWCYSTDAAVVGPACQKIGAVGTIRELGDVTSRSDAESYTRCLNHSVPAASSAP